MTTPNSRVFKNYIITGLLILTVCLSIGIYINHNSKQDFKAQVALLKTSLDSTKKTYNKEKGVWESSRQMWQADKDNLVAHLKSQHEKELADLAKKKDIREVITTKGELRVDTSVKTNVVYVKDTTTGETQEVRNIALQDSFINLKVVSYPDTSNINLVANTDLMLKVTYDGMITATPTSPYLKVNEIKGFNKVQKPKKNNWKYIVGGILGGALVYGLTN